ncbi:MAG: NAD-dependent epimerase/dehydratase family protein [Alphaproteobacteria bacterium]|nr:NAD-dependent epimerase/dehydratase family protein [Alphaproteobacteria bacterium]
MTTGTAPAPLALVTGATGFVGSAVVRALLATGLRVRTLVRPGSNRANLADLPVETAEGRLEDGATLKRALVGCTSLFHVAADYRLWVPDAEAMLATNVAGTRALMEAALAVGVKRIVYTSSVAVLAPTEDGSPADEATPSRLEDMIGPYKCSKFIAEQVVSEMIERRGLPAVIVNPSTPIGPRDIRPTPTGRVVLEAANGRVPAYVDTGLNLVHVDDVAAGHLLAFERGRVGRRYILGGDNTALADMLREIAAIVGRRPPLMALPRTALYPVAAIAEAWARMTGREPLLTIDGLRMSRKKMYFSSARAEQELGYRHRPARAALEDAIAWFRARGMCR